MPVEDHPPDHNRVRWTSAADALWKSIRDDTPLPGTTPAPTPISTAGPVLTITPDKISVYINNASGVTGRAGQAAAELGIQGFHITATATGTNLKQGVIVGYSSQNLHQVRTVAAAFPVAILAKDESAGNVVQVTLGTGSPYVDLVPRRLGTAPLPIHKAATPSAGVGHQGPERSRQYLREAKLARTASMPRTGCRIAGWFCITTLRTGSLCRLPNWVAARGDRQGGMEASPSPVYGARLLSGFGLIPIASSNLAASANLEGPSTPVAGPSRSQASWVLSLGGVDHGRVLGFGRG